MNNTHCIIFSTIYLWNYITVHERLWFAIGMCYSISGEETELSQIYHWMKMISDIHITAAKVFDRVMRAFFFQSFLGVRWMTLLVKEQGSFDCFMNSKMTILALLGYCLPLQVLFEAQSSTLLHPHFYLWGHLDHKVLAQWVYNEKNLWKEFTIYSDDIITARMPSLTVEMEKEKERTVTVCFKLSPPLWKKNQLK